MPDTGGARPHDRTAGGPDHDEARGVAHDFDSSYRGTPPWDIGRPQPALAELAGTGVIAGRVLDVGCGTGEHALLGASLGLSSTGVDLSPRAVAAARRKAAERGLDAHFVVGDALDLSALGLGVFDTVVDSGVFHVFGDEDRARYVRSLAQVTAPGGRVLLLCFSHRVPGGWGPRRVTPAEIRAAFARGWRVEAVDEVRMALTLDPGGVDGLRATITRLAS